jgi:hypothetical protein
VYVVLRHPSSSSLATLHCVLGDDVKKSDRGESEMRTNGAEEEEEEEVEGQKAKNVFRVIAGGFWSLCVARDGFGE